MHLLPVPSILNVSDNRTPSHRLTRQLHVRPIRPILMLGSWVILGSWSQGQGLFDPENGILREINKSMPFLPRPKRTTSGKERLNEHAFPSITLNSLRRLKRFRSTFQTRIRGRSVASCAGSTSNASAI